MADVHQSLNAVGPFHDAYAGFGRQVIVQSNFRQFIQRGYTIGVDVVHAQSTLVRAGDHVAGGDDNIGNQQTLGDALCQGRLTRSQRSNQGHHHAVCQDGGQLDADFLHLCRSMSDDCLVH